MSRAQFGSKVFSTLGATAAATLLVVSTAGCQSSTKAAKVGSDSQQTASSAATSSAAPANTVFKVGDQVKNGSWIVTVHKADIPYQPKSDFDKPKDGDIYVVLDVEVKNTDSKTQTFSSAMGFELKDSANHTYDETFLAEDGMPSVPEGDLAAGDSKRGTVAFEVPKDATGFKMEFRGGILDTQVPIDLGK